MAGNFVSIEKSKRKGILEDKIDANDYLGLRNDRGRLITYGISLGMDMPQEIVSRDSLYRPEYINTEMKAIMVAAVVNGLDSFDNLSEKLSDKRITEVTDACLNRGLDIIEDSIDNDPAQNYKLKKLSDLDKLYSENVEKN